MVNDHTHGRYLDDPAYTELWSALEELRVPLYLHPGSIPADDWHVLDGRPEMYGAAWSWQAETGGHALRLVFAGVFDRHPAATLILGHLGEFLPFQRSRLDSRYQTLQVETPLELGHGGCRVLRGQRREAVEPGGMTGDDLGQEVVGQPSVLAGGRRVGVGLDTGCRQRQYLRVDAALVHLGQPVLLEVDELAAAHRREGVGDPDAHLGDGLTVRELGDGERFFQRDVSHDVSRGSMGSREYAERFAEQLLPGLVRCVQKDPPGTQLHRLCVPWPVSRSRTRRRRPLLERVLRGAAQSLIDAISTVDQDAFERVAESVAHSRRVLFVAVGTSRTPATDAASRLTTIGLHAFAPEDIWLQQVQARQLSREDVCIAISRMGTMGPTIDAAEMARQGGATTVAMTSFLNAPLASICDHVLISGAAELGSRINGVTSQLALLAVLDAPGLSRW